MTDKLTPFMALRRLERVIGTEQLSGDDEVTEALDVLWDLALLGGKRSAS